jgi:hypothetical protein
VSAIEESGILPPLSCYTLPVPVTPLPRSIKEEAMRAGSEFLQQQCQRHERFLALALVVSYVTLAWLRNQATGTYNVREWGTFDGVKVLEFAPLGRPRSVKLALGRFVCHYLASVRLTRYKLEST